MGRRLRPTPGPGPEDLVSRTVHEVVRDYPETLVALTRVGVDVAAEGGVRLDGLQESERAVRTVLEVTAWRPDPPATPSTGKVRRSVGGSMGGRGDSRSGAPAP